MPTVAIVGEGRFEMGESVYETDRRSGRRRRTKRRVTDEDTALILESMSDAFVSLDREWRYTYVNAAMERIVRVGRNELLGKSVWEMFPEAVGTSFESAARRAMDGGVTVHLEEYYARFDRWFEFTVYPSPGGISVYTREITERRQMEEALRGQSRFIQQITELTPIVISVFDLVTERDTYLSSDVIGLSGYSPNEIAQMEDVVSSIWHPDDIVIAREHLERSKKAADGQISEYEYRVRHRDGGLRWLRSRSMPFARDEDGTVRQIVAATLDVTEQKRAEEALRKTEERFRSYFELGLIGMAITSPEKGILEVNDKLCEILGYERGELLQKTWAELTHPDDLAGDIVIFNKVISGQIEGYSLDKRWLRKDGQIINGEISVKCLRRVDGSVDYFIALLQDVTERKRADEALRRAHDELEHRVLERTRELSAINVELVTQVNEREQAEKELRRIETYLAEGQRLSHTGSWAWNASTGDLYWSKEHYRICGLDPEAERPDYPAMQWIHPDDRVFVKETFEQAIRERSHFELDCRVVWRDGSIRYVHSLAHPVFNASNNLTEYVGTIIDTTERKQAEEERRKLLRRLMAAQEEERYRISRELHDQLGQNLSVLGMKLAAIKKDCGAQANLCEQIDALQRVARQLDRDIDFLVWELRPTTLDDLGLLVALNNYVKNWTTHFNVHAELEVRGLDHERLSAEIETVIYRVTQEALNNIAKHAAAENVDILLESRTDRVSLIIEDDGVGFDGTQIFGMQQNGMGLIGMRERAMLAGGTLEVEAAPGSGTTIVVRIPLHPR
jgi:PAS domain S-box-containing protein